MSNIEKLTEMAHNAEVLQDKDSAYLFIDGNRILRRQNVEGLEVELREQDEGVDIAVRVLPGVRVRKPVHFCFGMLAAGETQKIKLNLTVMADASINVLSHCMFPRESLSRHLMEGIITLEEGATFRYLEKHIHSEKGTSQVYPHAEVRVGKNARFRTEFELIEGRVGLIDIDYNMSCAEKSVTDFISKISGHGNDRINIRETAVLSGEGARAVLRSRIAARDETVAEVHNKIVAEAKDAFGHVDCTEILQGRGRVKAYPEVEVLHPLAHVTHEASLGGVDNRQLETLMARGLTKVAAEGLIIRGLLS